MPLVVISQSNSKTDVNDIPCSWVSTESSTGSAVEGIKSTPSVTVQGTDEFEVVPPYGDGEYYSDEEEEDSCDSYSTSSTSVLSALNKHEYAHGRRYHSYKSGRYPLPNDVAVQHMEELKHQIMLELTDGHLFLADIGHEPRKILDIGTGSGNWAIDAADAYPGASIIGTDLSPTQPSWLPVNTRMFLDDCEEDEWLHGSGFDLVHLRDVAGYLHDLDGLLQRVYKNMKTGGWVEFQDFSSEICCDDDTMKEDDPLQRYTNLYTEGIRALGCDTFDRTDINEALERAGFINVQHVVKKVPIAGWAKKINYKGIGQMMKCLVEDSLGNYSAKPLAAMQIRKPEQNMLASKARESLRNLRIRRYVNLSFCYGQKGPQ